MTLTLIAKQLKNQDKGLPPVERWNPPYCGAIDIRIDDNGAWYYAGSLIKRMALVKLFSSVLIKESTSTNEEYFLVTPVEKMKITVTDAPFMLTRWAWLDDAKSIMELTTNVGDEFILNKEHPLIVGSKGELYVTVRRNLLAKVHRNVYYQWLEVAHEKPRGDLTEVVIFSDGTPFVLGSF